MPEGDILIGPVTLVAKSVALPATSSSAPTSFPTSTESTTPNEGEGVRGAAESPQTEAPRIQNEACPVDLGVSELVVNHVASSAESSSTSGQWLGSYVLPKGRYAGVGVGDLDGDSKGDLIAVPAGSKNLLVLRGHGDGSFAHVREVPVGLGADRVVVADFAGSPLADVLLISWAQKRALLMVTTAAFAFTDPKNVGLAPGATDVWIGQLDDHRASELVWITGQGAVVWSFYGTGQVVEWGTAPPEVRTALLPSSPFAWLGSGSDGGLQFAYYSHNPGEIVRREGGVDTALGTTPGGIPLLQLVAGDVDGDGRVDLIGLDATARVHTFRLRAD